jgi:ribonuclease P protein component
VKFTLGKNERLKHRKLIEHLFGTGKSFVSAPFRVHYSFEKLQSKFPAQAGFTVSAKNFKRAVDRNRIKRLTREAYRLQKEDLYNALNERSRQLIIFFVFTGREIPEYETVAKSMSSILKKLVKIVNEDVSPNT